MSDQQTKYRLLKDLPGLKAGAVFEVTNKRRTREIDIYESKEDEVGYRFVHFRLKETPNWFEPILENREEEHQKCTIDDCGCKGTWCHTHHKHEPHPSEMKEIEKIKPGEICNTPDEKEWYHDMFVLKAKQDELIEAVNIINQQLRRERE